MIQDQPKWWRAGKDFGKGENVKNIQSRTNLNGKLLIPTFSRILLFGCFLFLMKVLIKKVLEICFPAFCRILLFGCWLLSFSNLNSI